MRKRGFTLAEILISLGVIGVVAATVLPTFVTSHKKQVYEATRKTTESAFENALSAMMATEMAEDLTFTRIWSESNPDIYGILSNYFKSTSANGLMRSSIDEGGGIGFETKSGAVVSICRMNTAGVDDVAVVEIDTNGKDEPNVQDIDWFEYRLQSNGTLRYIQAP